MNKFFSMGIRALLASVVFAAALLVTDTAMHGSAHAYNTYMATLFPGDVAVNGDIKVIGNDILDDGETTRITLGATTTLTATTVALVGNVTASGTFIPSGAITVSTMSVNGLGGMRNHATPDASLVPTEKGQLVFNTTAGVPCVSTAASAGAWVVVGSTVVVNYVACPN